MELLSPDSIQRERRFAPFLPLRGAGKSVYRSPFLTSVLFSLRNSHWSSVYPLSFFLSRFPSLFRSVCLFLFIFHFFFLVLAFSISFSELLIFRAVSRRCPDPEKTLLESANSLFLTSITFFLYHSHSRSPFFFSPTLTYTLTPISFFRSVSLFLLPSFSFSQLFLFLSFSLSFSLAFYLSLSLYVSFSF